MAGVPHLGQNFQPDDIGSSHDTHVAPALFPQCGQKRNDGSTSKLSSQYWQSRMGRAGIAWKPSGILLGPVTGDRCYDADVSRRFQRAAAIVNDWPGLTRRERIALKSSLPWEQAVCFVWRECG